LNIELIVMKVLKYSIDQITSKEDLR